MAGAVLCSPPLEPDAWDQQNTAHMRISHPASECACLLVGAVVTGSHVDAIPLAGAYDGTLGVIGAIAALKALRQAGFSPEKPIEALMFTSEEPTRFGLGCIGRSAFQRTFHFLVEQVSDLEHMGSTLC